MPKEAFNAKKRTTFMFSPEDLVLVTDCTHPLYDARVELPVDDALVKSILRYGVIEPVVIAKEHDMPLVVDGRQRVKAAREADRISNERGGTPILVQCVYRQGTERDLFEVLVCANEHRHDVAFVVQAQTIKNWIKLLEFHFYEKERDAVRDGAATMSDVICTPRKPRLRYKKAIERKMKTITDPSIRKVLEWVLGLREEL